MPSFLFTIRKKKEKAVCPAFSFVYFIEKPFEKGFQKNPNIKYFILPKPQNIC